MTFVFFREQAGYISTIAWFLVAGLPSLGFRFSDRLFHRGKYERARQVKRFLCWLHPLHDWPWQDALYRAYDHASHGAHHEAVILLEQAQNQPPTVEQACAILYFRHDWLGLITWWESYPNRDAIENRIDLLRHYLRALGETGELNKLLQVIQKHYSAFSKVPTMLDYCYLYAFAFAGRIEQTSKLLHTSTLETLGTDLRTIWLATAYCSAGNHEMGQAILKSLLRTTKDGIVRAHAEQCIQRCLRGSLESISAENRQFLKQLERDWNAKQHLLSLWH
ncbi:MAG: hypothetical protein R3E79_59640 [Caldilineaceae bacterium]